MLKDLTGLQFSKLKVLKRNSEDYEYTSGKRLKRQPRWDCQCECGATLTVVGHSLKTGNTQSCGCHRKKMCSNLFVLHGKTKTPEYSSYVNMKNRCNNPSHKSYHHYGGRGITICERWLVEKGVGFLNFLEDMALCPEGYSLDREDVNGDYCPENCRWVNVKMQAFNRRKSSKNKSGRTGVRLGGSGRFIVEGGGMYLGSFDTLEEAARRRERFEFETYGEARND